MLLGQPRAQLGIARKAVRVLQAVLQRRQGGRRDALAEGWPRYLVAQSRLQAACSVRLEPGGHTMPVHAQQDRQVLTMAGVTARDQIQSLHALPLLDIFFLVQALVQLGGAFFDSRHPLSPAAGPSC